MANKDEVVEMEKNAWHEDWSLFVSDRWISESEEEALDHAHVCWVEAEMQRRTDVCFEAREAGEPIDNAGWEVPDDDVVFQALKEMGYTEEEILSVLK